MRKMTLLEMVQNIASALDTDEVNSITDTIESLQIAEIIKETFYEQFNNIFVPEHQSLVQLDSLNDVAKPNYLVIPDNVSKIHWLKYKDFRSGGQLLDLSYVTPEEFLTRQLRYVGGDNLFLTDDPSGKLSYYVRTDSRPQTYTIFDDKYIVFDNYDTEGETTVTGANSLAYATISQPFLMEDDFVPPIDGNLFPLLLAESKSVAFVNLKQMASVKEEQRARRQRIRMQNDQFRSKRAQYAYWERGPNFSRRR